MNKTVSFCLLGCILLSLVLSACNGQIPTTVAPIVATSVPALETPISTLEPVATVSALPRTLTVCLGQEPNSLYPLANLNSAARSVLSALYDGPIDAFINGYQPVILEKTPSIENGDAQVVPIPVKRGDPVVDINGNPTVLDLGVTVLPTGCVEEACSVKYDGLSDLQMDQMIVTFRMLPDLVWSDGAPLTAADSVYAFRLAADAATPTSKYLTDRTLTYEDVDEKTVQWWGKAGFLDPNYADNFWAPLPKQAWDKLTAAELAKLDVTKTPLPGWGPYVFEEWVAGNYIRLGKNPKYFRAAEGLPKFDTLIFNFVKDAESGISALVAGKCDLLDTSLRLDGQINLLTQLQNNDQAQLIVAPTTLIERLDFGIRPATYDNGISPATNDRPDFFGDVRTRQAIAYCLDRQKVVSTVLAGLTVVPDSFVPAVHPRFNSAVTKYPFDINKGLELLDQVGWKDTDKKASTPRVAVKVAGVPDGTPFVINYWTTSALQRRQVSEVLVQSLAQCGIQADTKYYDQNDFYAQGPGGPLFGRKFDLAEYAIGTTGIQPPCEWFLTSEIPTADNKWIGVNVSGLSNTGYDAVCLRAGRILPDKPEQKTAYDQAQLLFSNNLPSIPLYQRIKVAATRKDLCNYTLDAYSLNDLWNLEEIDYGAGCGQ